MSTRKAERLLNLVVMLLESHLPVTATEIHRTIPGYGQSNMDTFKRMFERDKEELRELGIPIELSFLDIWETEEGYRIPKDRYYLPELNLAKEEIAALWLAAGLVRMHDPSTVRSALMKLSDEEPDIDWHPKITADLGLAIPNLPKTFEAVADHKQITFSYRSRDGAVRKRQVDPYGLAHRKGAWYVVGHDHANNEIRVFRLDRIVGTAYMTEPSKPGADFEVPEGFRVEGALESPPFVQGEGIAKATVRFDASTAWWVERGAPWLRLVFDSSGDASAEIEVTDVTGFLSWLLSFGEGAELVSPPELREALFTRLEDICG